MKAEYSSVRNNYASSKTLSSRMTSDYGRGKEHEQRKLLLIICDVKITVYKYSEKLNDAFQMGSECEFSI